MTSPVLVTADLHLSDNPRDAYRFEFMKKLVRLAKGASAVVVLGDLTEEKDRHGAWLVNAVCDAIHDVARVCPVVINMGNHDYVDVNSPFYAFLGRIGGVTWVQAPTDSKNLPSAPLTALGRTLFLPHTSNYERDWAGLAFGPYDWIFAHQTFTGAHVGFGRTLNGIDAKAVFGKARSRVISGDIHVPQSDPVTYVGAPYTVDFGDDYVARYISIHDEHRAQSFRVTGVPQKRLVDVTAGSSAKGLEKLLGTFEAGDIVKMRITMRANQRDTWPALKKDAQEWAGKRGLVLYSCTPVIDKETIVPVDRAVIDHASDGELITMYAKTQSADETTVKVGHKIARMV